LTLSFNKASKTSHAPARLISKSNGLNQPVINTLTSLDFRYFLPTNANFPTFPDHAFAEHLDIQIAQGSTLQSRHAPWSMDTVYSPAD
jgi:hypothetical protein